MKALTQDNPCHKKMVLLCTLFTLGAAGAGMASIGWLKWPDLLVDFGSQVYISWQLSLGKVLYKDIHYLYGPLSAYTHSIVFRILGPGILNLVYFNFAVIGLITFLMYKIFHVLADRWTAFWASLIFLTVFAMPQYMGGGNFNFVTTYVYELPHGILLSFLTLYLFIVFIKKPDPYRILAIGFLVGLVFLTKAEVFLALCLGLSAGFFCYWKTNQEDILPRRNFILLFMAGFLIPLAAFSIYFSLHLPLNKAWAVIFNPWVYVMNSDLRSLPLYQWVSGFNDPLGNLLIIFKYLAGFLVVIGGWILAIKYTDSEHLEKYHLKLALPGLVCGILLYSNQYIPWLELMRPLPLILSGYILYLAYTFLKDKSLNSFDLFFSGKVALSVFSLGLLLKILLNTHVYHYGFALALPGTVVFVLIIHHLFPENWLEKPEQKQTYRNVLAIFILFFITNHVLLSHQLFSLKDMKVSRGKDLLYDYKAKLNPRGQIVNETLAYLEKEIPRDKTLAPVPHGLIINYWLRRATPVHLATYNPGEAALFPEKMYLEQFKVTSPDYLMILDSDASVLGARYFGKDYARETHSWIENNYEEERLFGAPPFSGKGFGIRILKRKTRKENIG